MTSHSKRSYSGHAFCRISFFVPGRPATAGSKKVFRHHTTKNIVVVDACKHGKEWRDTVKTYALIEMGNMALLKKVPVSIEVQFYLKRPKNHYRSGKFSALLRADHPVRHLQAPDVDKMSRAVLDALTGVVYYDDCLVVEKYASKEWADGWREPGASITVEVLM